MKASDILKESEDILLICIIKIKIFIYNKFLKCFSIISNFIVKKQQQKKAYFLLCEGLYFITNNILIKKNQHLINNVFIYFFYIIYHTHNPKVWHNF